jgi:selT/selW/selH-like putative selenoprotein
MRALLSRVVSILQIGIFVLPFLVTRIPAVMNHPYYRVFEQRKMMFLIGGYFLLNMLQTQISSTGAFEIYLDNRLIFSKLALGRMPNASELSKFIY